MSDFLHQKPLILASGSTIRRALLESLGLDFQIIPSNCDESAIKKKFNSTSPNELGLVLAQNKALEVSQRYPEHFVIAADQLCILDGLIFDKPLSHETAVNQLKQLQGKTHQQLACLCIAKGEKIIWQHHDEAQLHMRTLNDETIESYLKADQPYQSCGAYQFESLGKWLFKEVRGQADTILGLPLNLLIEALLSLSIVKFEND